MYEEKSDYGKQECSETAASLYWEDVIKTKINEGKIIVINSDNVKRFFGEDYDETRRVCSRAAFLLFERAVKEVSYELVLFTAGGAGSGKSEFVVNELLREDIHAIVYDSTFCAYEGAKQQILMARAYGKNIHIIYVLVDLLVARSFTKRREKETGRAVGANRFIQTHRESIKTLLKLLDEEIINEENIHIVDARPYQETKEVGTPVEEMLLPTRNQTSILFHALDAVIEYEKTTNENE